MSIKTAIEDLELQIKTRQKHLAWLRQYQDVLPPNCNPVSYCSQIDFEQPDHATAIKIMAGLKAGKWEKEVNNTSLDRINYVTEIDGMTVRIWNSEPPGSCRIVEEEVLVPAQPERYETRKKLVCAGGEV